MLNVDQPPLKQRDLQPHYGRDCSTQTWPGVEDRDSTTAKEVKECVDKSSTFWEQCQKVEQWGFDSKLEIQGLHSREEGTSTSDWGYLQT
jgi:hypothetical protein